MLRQMHFRNTTHIVEAGTWSRKDINKDTIFTLEAGKPLVLIHDFSTIQTEVIGATSRLA